MGCLQALNAKGELSPLPVDGDGHLEVAIHSPKLPFGAIHSESLTPVFQCDGVYGINSQLVTTSSSLSGVATTESSMYKVSTGTTIYGFATIQSRKRLRYRPGQGLVGRFAGIFDAGVTNSILVAGYGHAEDGFFFGYNGTSFGILHSRRGVREIQTLTISTGSSTNENVTITLAGTAYSVAVTNSASTLKTSYEISIGTYAGWKAEQVDSTVIFVKDAVGNATGTFSLVGSTAVGTFAETMAGVAATETWYPQTSWNCDTMNGSGISGITLNPQTGNVYGIDLEYLGFGAIRFFIETNRNGNNPTIHPVHTISYANANTSTSVGNPSFPFTMAAYSAGSTSNLSVKVGSFAGFTGGAKILNGPHISHFNNITTAGSSSYQAIFTIRNGRYYGGRSNQSVINLSSFAAAMKHTQPATIYLIRGGTLGGTPNFTSVSATSCAYIDTAATTITPAANSDIIFALPLAETGQLQLTFPDEVTLQPGETITLAAKTTSGTAAHVIASLNTREDH